MRIPHPLCGASFSNLLDLPHHKVVEYLIILASAGDRVRLSARSIRVIDG